MRNSSLIFSRQWLGGTMQKVLKDLGPDGFVVANYFMTSPLSHMSGLYYCPISETARHTKTSIVRVKELLDELQKKEFCEFDDDMQIVWVTNMARYQYQIDDLNNTKDNRIKGLIAHLRGLPDTYLLPQFLDYYKLDFDISNRANKGASEAPSEGVCLRGIGNPPSHPIRSHVMEGAVAGSEPGEADFTEAAQ